MSQPFIYPADRDLERRVTLFVEQKRLTSNSRVIVEARLGVVTLKGTVPSFHRRQLLSTFARHVAGVVQVVDELNVDWPWQKPRTDRRQEVPVLAEC